MIDGLLESTMASANFDLFTVGHSNHPVERFLALLEGARIAVIADVRSRPSSRRFPWFSQARLAETLQTKAIGYLAHGDALGGRPDDLALIRDGVADYEAIAKTTRFQQGLDRVIAAAAGRRLCVMCAEREPLDCHRFLLIARALAARGVAIGHILADTTVETHAATEERLLAVTRTAADLFASREERLAEAYRRRAGAVAFRA
jgi:uncharacterized protein (DUF488 family)